LRALCAHFARTLPHTLTHRCHATHPLNRTPAGCEHDPARRGGELHPPGGSRGEAGPARPRRLSRRRLGLARARVVPQVRKPRPGQPGLPGRTADGGGGVHYLVRRGRAAGGGGGTAGAADRARGDQARRCWRCRRRWRWCWSGWGRRGREQGEREGQHPGWWEGQARRRRRPGRQRCLARGVSGSAGGLRGGALRRRVRCRARWRPERMRDECTNAGAGGCGCMRWAS
jgi:hypothetical protein